MLRLDTASLYASSTAASTTASVPAPASDSLQDVPAANDSLPPPSPGADTVTLSDEGLARLRDDPPPPPPPRHDKEELEQTVSSLEADMDELQQQLSALEQDDDPRAQQKQASLKQKLGELSSALDDAQQKLDLPPEEPPGPKPVHGPIAAYLAHKPQPNAFQAVPA
ncbi:hypothetical protein ABHF91_00635 [Pseudaeromonas sp. ZJS20]|uniref:hypothetical protein n=1 Tax=Pseudaeromonas aegiceratis TaxID=3153928 RepID=UPI00390CBB8B